MAEILKGKNALHDYTESRLAAAPVQHIISTAQPQSVSADEVLRMRDRLVGAATTAAERQVEHRQQIETAKSETELLEAQEGLEDARDQRTERGEERRRRAEERREEGQLSVIGLLREVISGGGPGAQDVAALREQLNEMTEKQREGQMTAAIDELRAQHEELRTEIRTATAADGGSSSVDVVEEFERIARLQERARALFGDGIPAQTAMDLKVLEIKHRQSVQLMELENRLSLDGRRLRLEEERAEREQIDRDQRAGQIDSFLETVGPVVERVVDQWGQQAGGANGATAAPQVLAAPDAGVVPGSDGGASPVSPLPAGVAAQRCSNPGCGVQMLVYQGQNLVVCQSCGMVSLPTPPAGAAATVEAEPA